MTSILSKKTVKSTEGLLVPDTKFMEGLPLNKVPPEDVKAFNRKGFTLTEVMVAAVIVAILSAGVFSAFFASQRFLSRSKHRIQALNFAREALDRMRSSDAYEYNDIAIGTGLSDSTISSIITGEMANLGATITYDVGLADSSDPNSDKAVTIHVTWTEKAELL